MKKVTILMAALVGLGGVASAQRISKYPQLAGSHTVTGALPTFSAPKTAAKTAGASDTIYKQTFAGGIPAGWKQYGVPSNALWEGRTMVGSDTSGARGAFDKTRIKSPTVKNGFVIFDSDYLDNGGKTLPNGSPDTSKGSCNTPHKGVLKSTGIDCSTHAGVILHFNQYFRRFAGYTSVLVSNGVKDSLYEVNVGTPIVNGATATNSEVNVNISDIAGGNSFVTIAFVFDGSKAYTGANGKGYYDWQIDDVSLLEPNAGDLALQADTMYNYYTNGITTQVPIEHLRPGFQFGADVYNFSAGLIGDARVDATIVNTVGPTTIATISSPLQGIGPFKSYHFSWADATDGLPGRGSYQITLSANSANTPDSRLSNNSTKTYNITVGDSVFARDNGKLSQVLGTASYAGGTGEGFGILNQYDLFKKDSVQALSVYLGSATTPGSTFEVRILDTALAVITASDIYEVQGGDPGTFVKVGFNKTPARVLNPGTYYAAVYCYEQDQTTSPVQQITFGDDLTIPQPAGGSYLNLGTSTYTNGNAWLLRMIMDRTAGVTALGSVASKNGLSLSQNVPNPFNGVSTINYSVASTDKVTLTVTDVTGRKVSEINEGVKTAGAYQISLNAGDFNKGIYFYTLTVGSTSLTKKMVITQ